MVETRRRTLELSLKARNLSQQAFLSVERSLKRIRNAGRKAFDGIVRAARSARGQLLGIVAAVGGAQKLVIEPAAFEDSLTRITIAGDEFADKITEIRGVIEELATSTGTSRDDLAEGFEAAAKRVRTFEEAVLLVDTANKLAAVSGGSVVEAVTGLDTVIENFGGSVAEVDQIAAKLFETTRRLPESQGEILTQLGNIAPQARLAGLELDDLLAAVATAEQRGVRASATFTALRTILDQLVSPTGAAEEKFAALGVRTGEAALAGENVGEVFARVIDNADELGIKLGDLGLRGRSVNAFLAIGSEQGRAFAETLEGISGGSVPEFQKAFDRVNSTTKSSIDAFGELAKVAADAFAGAYLDDFGKRLGEANNRVEQVRTIAALAGLEFRQWVERIRPGLAAVRAFFEAVDNGLAVIRTAAETLVAVFRSAFLQIRALGLEVFVALSDFIDSFLESVVDRFRDLGVDELLAKLTGTEEFLTLDPGVETRRDQLERVRELAQEIQGVRGELAQLEVDANAAEERGDTQSANLLRSLSGNFDRQIERLQEERTKLIEAVAQTDANPELRAAASRARAEADAFDVFDELERITRERGAVLSQESADVRDAFSAIGESALDSEANVAKLEARIAELRRTLEELQSAPATGSGVEAATSRVQQAAARVREALQPDPASSDDQFRDVEEQGDRAARSLEQRFRGVQSVLSSSLGSAFSGFIQGANEAKDVARSFFQQVADGLARLAAQKFAEGIISQLFSAGTSSATGGGAGGGSVATAADGGVIPVRAFAAGGMVRTVSSSPAVRAFASGGPFSGGLPSSSVGRVPNLGLFAEAGMPEGIVALPDGESVPLRLDGAGTPVVALPGGRTIPVRVRGDGMSDEEAAQRLLESVRDGGGAVAPLGAAGGVLRRPTLAEIPDGGPALAAIPLPTGEAVPVRVRRDGTTVVELPKGRSLPTAGTETSRRFRGPRVPVQAFAAGGYVGQARTPQGRTPQVRAFAAGGAVRSPERVPVVRAFADGGYVAGLRVPAIRAFADGGAVTPDIPSAIHRAEIPSSSALRPTASGGVAVGDTYQVQIQALDGPSVERILSSPEGRRSMESAFRQATRTRRDFRR